MTESEISRDLILNSAVELARQSSWEAFSLHQLAVAADCPLTEIKARFRSKDDLAEALFDRADEAMLKVTEAADYQALDADERLIRCIMAWFEQLAPVKPLVKEILAYKLEPGHFHLQAHGITRISRTVQWFLVVAQRDYTGLQRITDEMAVSGSYLLCFSRFLVDDSEQHRKTRELLEMLIKRVARGNRGFGCFGI